MSASPRIRASRRVARKPVVKFATSDHDGELIQKIVDRAVRMDPKWVGDQVSTSMDITATHCNGTNLDLQKFLDFDEFNFWHDFDGIRNCIDRTTGKLTRHFRPRCARDVR